MREESSERELVRSFDLGPIKGIPVADEADEADPAFAEAQAEYARACTIAQALHSPDELIGGMGHEEWLVRLEVIDRLLARASDDERTLPVLLEHLRDDESAEVRGHIASILGRFAPPHKSGPTHPHHEALIDALFAAEADAHSGVRWEVQFSLWQFGLRPWPGDSTPEIREGDVASFGTPADIAHNWGITHLGSGDLAAIADFDEAIRLEPDSARHFVGRGLARDLLGKDSAAAIVDFDEAIRLDPDDGRQFRNRGDLRQRTGDLEGAIVDFSEAIRVDPDFGDAFLDRAGVRLRMGDLEGAIADLGEAIGLDPEDSQLFGLRADARRLNGNLAGALADHDEAVRLDPTDIGSYGERATTRELVGDVDGAIDDYEKAARLAPGDTFVSTKLKRLRRRHRSVFARFRSERRLREAAHRYLVIAADANARHEDIDGRYMRDDYVPFDAVCRWCAETARVFEKAASELRSSIWPRRAQDEAERLAMALNERAAVCDAAARAPTGSDAVDLLYSNTRSERALANAVNALRLALGLPIKHK